MGNFRLTWPRIVALAAAASLTLATAGEFLFLPKDRLGLKFVVTSHGPDSTCVVLWQTQHDMSGRFQLEVRFDSPQSPIVDARVGPIRSLFVEPLRPARLRHRMVFSGAAPTDSGRVGFRWPSDDSIYVGLGRLVGASTNAVVADWWWFSSDDRSNDSARDERIRQLIRMLQALCGLIAIVSAFLSADKKEDVRRRRLEDVFERIADEFVPLTEDGEALRKFLALLVVEQMSPQEALKDLQPLDVRRSAWIVKESKRIRPIFQERFGAEALRPVTLLDRLTG